MIIERDGFKWLVRDDMVFEDRNQDEIAAITEHESIQLSWVKDLKGKLFIDIGAHLGYWSLRMSRNFEEVWAFEPCSKNREGLIINLEMNDIRNVKVLPFALGDKRTKIVLQAAGGGTSVFRDDGWFTEEVEVYTLDSFELEPDFIKIDTEGFEIPVLKGAINTLRNSSPLVMIEEHEYRYGHEELKGTNEAIRKFFRDLGYVEIEGFYYKGSKDRHSLYKKKEQN